jgi:hypothetical protein
MTQLTDVLKPLPSLTATDKGHTVPIHWQCHQAVLAWIYEALFSRTVTGVEVLTFFLDCPPIMKAIIAQGMRVFPPATDKIYVTPGSVLVFSRQGNPEHSCIMKENDKIIGYNQMDWFTGPGYQSAISTHDTSELKWQGGVVTRQNKNYVLWAIPERLACEVVRQQVVARTPEPAETEPIGLV